MITRRELLQSVALSPLLVAFQRQEHYDIARHAIRDDAGHWHTMLSIKTACHKRLMIDGVPVTYVNGQLIAC